MKKPALEYSDENFNNIFGLNFVSPIKLTLSLFSKLKSGLIINISSISDRYPEPLFGLYGSSKAALNLYFETIASENTNVQVINLLPDNIDTPLQHIISDDDESFNWESCMSTFDVAESVIYILENKEKIVSGSRIIITSNILDDGEYNPEKLLVYNTDTKKCKKIDK